MKPNDSLTTILEEIDHHVSKHKLDVGELLKYFSRKSFGVLLVIPGVALAIPPIGAIPGIPFMMGLFIVIVSIQIVFSIKNVWLPRRVLAMNISQKKIRYGIKHAKRIAKYIDGHTKRRLTWVLTPPIINFVGFIIMILGLLIMFIGFIPFIPAVLGMAVLLFGVSLITGDGGILLIGLTAASLLATVIYSFAT
mgnify:CR=1 FL=1